MKRTELVSEINSVVNFIKDFKTEALLPVFEAVVNSIQAIEDRNGLGDNGEIIVVINRDRQGDLFGAEGRREPEIESFEIVDNGERINFKEGYKITTQDIDAAIREDNDLNHVAPLVVDITKYPHFIQPASGSGRTEATAGPRYPGKI